MSTNTCISMLLNWRSKDELKSDVLIWPPADGDTSVDRPVKTYIYQFCSNTGCSLEDLPKAIDDRDRW